MSFIGDLIGADASRSASNKASDAQVRATQIATDEQRRQYDLYRSDQQPYRDAGYAGLNQLKILLGLGGVADKPMQRSEEQLRAALAPRYANDPAGLDAAVRTWQEREAAKMKEWQTNGGGAEGFGSLTKQFTGENLQNDPGYQFGLQQGTDAIQSSASARGGLFSGATQKALAKYGQDYAGTKFNEAFGRNQAYQTDLFNRLSGLSGTGQQATQSVGAAGQNFANQFGNYSIQGGNARAANYLNQGNILSNLAGKAGDMMGGYFGF